MLRNSPLYFLNKKDKTFFSVISTWTDLEHLMAGTRAKGMWETVLQCLAPTIFLSSLLIPLHKMQRIKHFSYLSTLLWQHTSIPFLSLFFTGIKMHFYNFSNGSSNNQLSCINLTVAFLSYNCKIFLAYWFHI